MNYNPQLVLTLRQFGEQLRENGMDNLLYFTPGPEANRFVQQPNPFLIGVLFDQNIAAEMAWAAPYRLYQRLGHLDIERIAAMSAEGLSEIITRFPALHRYVRQMGVNLLALAQRLQVQYGGNASNIWSDYPSARILESRLQEFRGIGQKKAAMTVALLAKCFMVPIQDLENVDIAFDVHIRRVFLRTGLVEKDDLQSVLAAAREAAPDFPGALDLPSWVIGREWCRPTNPRCGLCPLNQPCPSSQGIVLNLLPEVGQIPLSLKREGAFKYQGLPVGSKAEIK